MNSNFKMPIAYFLTTSINATFFSAVITESVNMLNECHIRCSAIVMDGLPANIKATKLLGIDLTPGRMKTWFINPNGVDRIYVIFDVCHMIKLLRNLWKNLGFLRLYDKVLNWRYIEELVRLQTDEGLKAANRLSSRHVNFELQKMKVNLAVQTFSSSVGKAISLCEELNVEGFGGSHETSVFIQEIDKIFDMLNSKNPLSKGFKAPLTADNAKNFKDCVKQIEKTLLNLRTPEGNYLYTTKLKTGVIGLCASMRSVEGQLDGLVLCKTPILKYLLTYKLSQDHLETFFSVLRSTFGFNNNPNPAQLRSAFQRILAAKVLPVMTGNCIPQDETEISIIQPNMSRFIPNRFQEYEEVEDLPSVCPENLSQFSSCVVAYISGWVVRKLKLRVKCEPCVMSLESKWISGDDIDRRLICTKDNGGLCNPSNDVIRLCKYLESLIRTQNVGPQFSAPKLHNSAVKFALDYDLFSSLSVHLIELEPMDNHIYHLVKLISKEYCTLRMHHSAREYSLKKLPKTIRNLNTNLIQFAGN